VSFFVLETAKNNRKILYCTFTYQLLVHLCMLLKLFCEICISSARGMNNYAYSRNDTSRTITPVSEGKLVPVSRCPLRKPQGMDLNRTQTSVGTGS